MEASIPNHSSFTWRSIAQARKVISMGSRWCVAQASISIWNDKWIPTNGGQKVISPMSRLQENAKVKELLTPSLSWNTKLIEEIFLPFEANLISQIPLRGTHKPDRQVWASTSNGMFSVQSAYQMLVEDLKIKELGTSTTSQRWKVFWKNLWLVKVPQKIKVFMWKACSNILPTCTKLFDQNIVSNFSCSVCGDEAETRDHLFYGMPSSHQCLEGVSNIPFNSTTRDELCGLGRRNSCQAESSKDRNFLHNCLVYLET